jgi:hypothetical protein
MVGEIRALDVAACARGKKIENEKQAPYCFVPFAD